MELLVTILGISILTAGVCFCLHSLLQSAYETFALFMLSRDYRKSKETHWKEHLDKVALD